MKLIVVLAATFTAVAAAVAAVDLATRPDHPPTGSGRHKTWTDHETILHNRLR